MKKSWPWQNKIDAGEKLLIMRFKWLADGCESWEEVIKALRDRIKECERLADEGYRVVDSHDGYLTFESPDSKPSKI